MAVPIEHESARFVPSVPNVPKKEVAVEPIKCVVGVEESLSEADVFFESGPGCVGVCSSVNFWVVGGSGCASIGIG